MGGFVRNAGTTGGNYTRSYPFTFSVSVANTWQYVTVVIPGDTTGQWITGQTDGVGGYNTKKRPASSPTLTVLSTLESSNVGSLDFDQSSARFLVPLTATGDCYGQWRVSVDAEF